MRSIFVAVPALALVCLLGWGCGGKVVFTEGGGEGVGGEGSGEAPTIESACEALCNRLPQCISTGGNATDCLSSCATATIPDCEQETAALLQCFAEELPADCIPTTSTCVAEVFDLAGCGGFSEPSP
jgi:hypothetical protein